MDERIMLAALAGLLHDIGKFAQRAGEKPALEFNPVEYGAHGYHALLSDNFVARYVPEHLQKGLIGVLYHHNPKDKTAQLIQMADWLAAGERRKGGADRELPKEARLIPILNSVTLTQPVPSIQFRHLLTPLNAISDSAYPVPIADLPSANQRDYTNLWLQMVSELDLWKQRAGETWKSQPIEVYYTSLLSLLHKYTWCIPAATPWQSDEDDRIWPDVSLYDHLRLTSAIAACLAADNVDAADLEQNLMHPAALALRGDVSGIQNYIYRITRPEAETEHVAKRLRGRSMYISLLVDTVVDWLLREFGLPVACALYVGGGKFDMLLPVQSREKLEELTRKLNDWMLDIFDGELSLHMGVCLATAADFVDMRQVYRLLDENLETQKRQKWLANTNQQNFFTPEKQGWHVCRVCQMTPMDESNICSICREHEQIGKYLPHCVALAIFVDGKPSPLPPDRNIIFPESPFGIYVGMIMQEDDINKISSSAIQLMRLNDAENFIIPGIACSFRYLANAAPKAIVQLSGGGIPPVHAGDVLHFEALAELSTGAKRLGVLKADVDYLGLVFGEGLSEEQPGGLRPTISRLAAISRMLDYFFGGQLNRICQEVFYSWKSNSQHSWKDKIDGLFYILYSGGDDLLIVGPWDAVLELASHLQAEFARYTGHNPNLTISAGYVQVKPRYPVQKFAEMVDQAEKQAKDSGRNRITAFDQVMPWLNGTESFTSLRALAADLKYEIENLHIPRGLIIDLGEVHRQHFSSGGRTPNPMWTPRLYYTFARRLSKDTVDRYGERLLDAVRSGKVQVPVSIVSLILRKD